MSYEGGGGAQGPAGPTGPTGGISFSGPNGAVLWYDGTAVTGTTGLTWTQTGGMGNAHRLFGGPNGNYLELDDGTGSMAIFVDQIDAGHGLLLAAGATRITLQDDVTGATGITGTLQLQISGNNGASGDVLTSDGTYAIWQAPAAPVYTASAYGQTGATGSLLNNGTLGTELMSTTISTGVTGNILGQVAIQIQNADSDEHAASVYLVVAGSTGGVTTHTIPKHQAGLNGSSNLTLFYRTATTEPTGIYTISVYGYSDTDSDVFYNHIDLVGLGNLDGPGGPV